MVLSEARGTPASLWYVAAPLRHRSVIRARPEMKHTVMPNRTQAHDTPDCTETEGCEIANSIVFAQRMLLPPALTHQWMPAEPLLFSTRPIILLRWPCMTEWYCKSGRHLILYECIGNPKQVTFHHLDWKISNIVEKKNRNSLLATLACWNHSQTQLCTCNRDKEKQV